MVSDKKRYTGYPSIDKPWRKFFSDEAMQAPLPEKSLYEYMYEHNCNDPDGIAINYYGTRITFGELFDRIDEAARAFFAAGVRETDIVTVLALNCPQYIVCFYALNRIGAVSNFINVLSTQKELDQYFIEAESKVVVTLDLFTDKVVAAAREHVKNIVVFSLDLDMPFLTGLGYRMKMRKQRTTNITDVRVIGWEQFIDSGRGVTLSQNYHKDPHTMCMLAHTGGTTGSPKGVELSDFAMNTVVDSYIYRMPRERGDVFLGIMVPFVVFGNLGCMHVPLSMGWCIALIPKFEPDKWAYYFKKYKPNDIDAVPSWIAPMLNDPKLKSVDLSKLYGIGVGGDGMTDALESDINAFLKAHGSKVELYKGYGMTEACATCIVVLDDANKHGSVGIPLLHNNVMIYDNENKCELTYNQTGEVCIQSPSRMIGYRNNEEATKELFRIHDDGSEWLHTGDLGYLDEDGFLFLVGRMKRIILTSKEGIVYKVFPNILEEEISKHGAVDKISIVGVMSGTDEVLKAFVVLHGDYVGRENEVEQELRKFCDDNLVVYMRPIYYEFLKEMPLTAAGKVDYRSLEAMSNK